MTKTKESLFVLFTAHHQQVASGACYIALDGFPTVVPHLNCGQVA